MIDLKVRAISSDEIAANALNCTYCLTDIDESVDSGRLEFIINGHSTRRIGEDSIDVPTVEPRHPDCNSEDVHVENSGRIPYAGGVIVEGATSEREGVEESALGHKYTDNVAGFVAEFHDRSMSDGPGEALYEIVTRLLAENEATGDAVITQERGSRLRWLNPVAVWSSLSHAVKYRFNADYRTKVHREAVKAELATQEFTDEGILYRGTNQDDIIRISRRGEDTIIVRLSKGKKPELVHMSDRFQLTSLKWYDGSREVADSIERLAKGILTKGNRVTLLYQKLLDSGTSKPGYEGLIFKDEKVVEEKSDVGEIIRSSGMVREWPSRFALFSPAEQMNRDFIVHSGSNHHYHDFDVRKVKIIGPDLDEVSVEGFIMEPLHVDGKVLLPVGTKERNKYGAPKYIDWCFFDGYTRNPDFDRIEFCRNNYSPDLRLYDGEGNVHYKINLTELFGWEVRARELTAQGDHLCIKAEVNPQSLKDGDWDTFGLAKPTETYLPFLERMKGPRIEKTVNINDYLANDVTEQKVSEQK